MGRITRLHRKAQRVRTQLKNRRSISAKDRVDLLEEVNAISISHVQRMGLNCRLRDCFRAMDKGWWRVSIWAFESFCRRLGLYISEVQGFSPQSSVLTVVVEIGILDGICTLIRALHYTGI